MLRMIQRESLASVEIKKCVDCQRNLHCQCYKFGVMETDFREKTYSPVRRLHNCLRSQSNFERVLPRKRSHVFHVLARSCIMHSRYWMKSVGLINNVDFCTEYFCSSYQSRLRLGFNANTSHILRLFQLQLKSLLQINS